MTRTNFDRATDALQLTSKMKEITGEDKLGFQVEDALCHLMHLCRLICDEEGNDIDFDDCLIGARINFEAQTDDDLDN